MKFDDIENAFMSVSMAPKFANSAILSKEIGEIFYVSEYGDSDEMSEDVDDLDKYITIPHRNDLDLVKMLVFDFVSGHLPDALQEVDRIFNQQGSVCQIQAALREQRHAGPVA